MAWQDALAAALGSFGIPKDWEPDTPIGQFVKGSQGPQTALAMSLFPGMNGKIPAGSRMFRGTETGPNPLEALRKFKGGDLGDAVYFTPDQGLAASYGGGPAASVAKGSRTVHSYSLNRDLEPNEFAHVYGGSKYNEPIQVVRGDGTVLYEGPWSGKTMESVLAPHNLKAVFGAPESIGINQIGIRDPSIVDPIP